MATVSDKGELFMQVPKTIKPGTHKAVLVLEERTTSTASTASKNLDDFPVICVGSWPEGFRVSREEIYGDNGR